MGIIIDPKFGSKTYFIYLFVLFFFSLNFNLLHQPGDENFESSSSQFFSLLFSSWKYTGTNSHSAALELEWSLSQSKEALKTSNQTKKKTRCQQNIYTYWHTTIVSWHFFFLLLCSLLSGKQKKRGKKMQHILPAGSLSDYLSALGLAWQPA